MKQTVKAAIAALYIVLALAGCQQPLDAAPEESSLTAGIGTGAGAVIRIESPAARTLIPAALTPENVSRYVVTLEKDEDTVTYTASDAAAKEEITGIGHAIDLATGVWTVVVDAYRSLSVGGGEAQEYKAATGAGTLVVVLGEMGAVQVALSPIEIAEAEGIKGVFSWNIQLPENADITTFSLGEPVAYTAEGGVSAGSLEKDPGIYSFDITFTNTQTGQIAGIHEKAYIYPGLVTAADYDFRDWNFADKVYLAGTVHITRAGPPGGSALCTVKAYSNQKCNEAAEIPGARVEVEVSGTAAPFILAIDADEYGALPVKNVWLKVADAVGHIAYLPTVQAVEGLEFKGRDGLDVSVGLIMYYTVRYNKNKPENASQDVTGVMDDSLHTYRTGKELAPNGYALTGWTYAGWATSPDGGVFYHDGDDVIDLTETAGATVDLWAVWTANSYALTLLDQQNGSGGTENVTATFDSPMPPIDPPALTGYTFSGYYTEEDGEGTQYYTGAGESARPWGIPEDDTLYALWEANQYTIEYDGNGHTGGEVPESQTKTYNEDLVLQYNTGGLEKTGYSFSGWNLEPSGPGTPYEEGETLSVDHSTEQGDTVKLYARWQAITVVYEPPVEPEILWTVTPSEASISQLGNGILTVTVDVSEGQWANGATFAWYKRDWYNTSATLIVDEADNPITSNTITIRARKCAQGTNFLTVEVTKDNDIYSKELAFTVTE